MLAFATLAPLLPRRRSRFASPAEGRDADADAAEALGRAPVEIADAPTALSDGNTVDTGADTDAKRSSPALATTLVGTFEPGSVTVSIDAIACGAEVLSTNATGADATGSKGAASR